MARFRVRWKQILFNLPMIMVVVGGLINKWRPLRDSIKEFAKTDPEVMDFVADVDVLYDIIKGDLIEKKN